MLCVFFKITSSNFPGSLQASLVLFPFFSFSKIVCILNLFSGFGKYQEGFLLFWIDAIKRDLPFELQPSK